MRTEPDPWPADRIAHYLLKACADGPRNVLHRARLGHDMRLKKGERHKHYPAAHLRDEIGHRRIAAHQRHLAEGLAVRKVPEHLPSAVRRRHRRHDFSLQNYAEKMHFIAREHDRRTRRERLDARAIRNLLTLCIGKIREQCDVGFEKGEIGWVHNARFAANRSILLCHELPPLQRGRVVVGAFL